MLDMVRNREAEILVLPGGKSSLEPGHAPKPKHIKLDLARYYVAVSGDTPCPPHYRRQASEPPRVQPSRAQVIQAQIIQTESAASRDRARLPQR
jgi:hypothetical protein